MKKKRTINLNVTMDNGDIMFVPQVQQQCEWVSIYDRAKIRVWACTEGGMRKLNFYTMLKGYNHWVDWDPAPL